MIANQLVQLGYISAGGAQASLGTVVWQDGNGISFGVNGQTVTGAYTVPVQSNQVMSIYFASNTAGESTSFSRDARSITFHGAGIASMGYSNGSIVVSVPAGGGAVGSISAGATRATLGEIVFSNSNGVGFGVNGQTITASVPTQTVQPGIQSISAGGTRISTGEVVFSDANGMQFGIAGQTLTASYTVPSVPAQSNQSMAFFMQGNTTDVTSSGTLNATSINFKAYGILSIGFSQSSINFSVPAPAAQSNQTLGVYFYSQTTAVTSTGTLNATSLNFAGYGGVSVGFSNSSVVISGAAGGAVSLYSYEPYPLFMFTNSGSAVLSVGTNTSAILTFIPFRVEQYVNADMMNLVGNLSFITMGTSSGRQSMSISYGIYSRGTGANNSTLARVTSGSFGLSVTYNNSTITINQPTSSNNTGYITNTVSSAGLLITSAYTGFKMIQFPVKSTIAPGDYWLALAGMNSSNSNSGGLRVSWVGGMMGVSNLGPIGSYSTAFSSGTNFTRELGAGWHFGHGRFTSAGQTDLISTLALSNLSGGESVIPVIKFWSTL